MQIISSRTYLFEKEVYRKEEGKEIVREVTDKIIVRAIKDPQLIPDWVAETDLFKMAVEDGCIVAIELAGGSPNFAINNETKAGLTGAATPVAALANASDNKDNQKPTTNDGMGGWSK